MKILELLKMKLDALHTAYFFYREIAGTVEVNHHEFADHCNIILLQIQNVTTKIANLNEEDLMNN